MFVFPLQSKREKPVNRLPNYEHLHPTIETFIRDFTFLILIMLNWGYYRELEVKGSHCSIILLRIRIRLC